MRRVFATVTMLVGFASCSARPQPHSDAGRMFAERLCAIQDQCACADDLLIPDCEARVEREFADNERKAVEAGLDYDAACMEDFLQRIDGLGTCQIAADDNEPPCPVYHGDSDIGDPCEVFDLIPSMTDCRVGSSCIQGTCRDPDNPTILSEGAICAVEQSVLPTRWLGTCGDGLQCDSLGSRTCVPSMFDPAPLGGACTSPYECLDGNICRPQSGDLEPSEERPGTCVERTPPGEPCTVVYECDRICEDGRCQIPPPASCELLEDWWIAREIL